MLSNAPSAIVVDVSTNILRDKWNRIHVATTVRAAVTIASNA